MTATDQPRCVISDCTVDAMDPRGLIEFAIPDPPYRVTRPACIGHFDLLAAIGLPVVRSAS